MRDPLGSAAQSPINTLRIFYWGRTGGYFLSAIASLYVQNFPLRRNWGDPKCDRQNGVLRDRVVAW
ncbi:hypothetical protein [Cylindrospermopsis sp. CR12]|uniref:hypothetical protein n=1 Tax=Cylindrospermopsis sp. CR12 TaxID=1747196 RepID=UPI00128EFF38|nr:hypothetical protein [Cylindrospermopsis sp. CR12]